MTLFKSILLSTSLLMIYPFALAANPSEESVKELLAVTGAGDMAVNMMEQMIPSMKRMMPNAPEEFWIELSKQIDGKELEELVVPVYQKYLTQEDVDAQLRFLKSDAGQKMVQAQPLIVQESMMIGQQWGIQLLQRAQQTLNSTSD